MKKTILSISMALVIALSFSLFTSCSGGGGFYEDVTNEVKYKYKSLSVGGYNFYNGDTKLSGNEIPYGSKMKFALRELEGFTEKNGKVMLLTTIKVKDKSGKVIIESDDLFKDVNAEGGLNAADARAALSLSVGTLAGLKVNSEYTSEFLIKDKNGKAEITGSFKIKVVNIEGAKYSEEGLYSDGPFFVAMPGEKILTDNNITGVEKLNCYFYNMGGLVSENGKVFPDASIVLKDGSGKVLEEYQDLFKEQTEGLDEAQVKEAINLSYRFGDLERGKKYVLEFIFKDKRGTGSLMSSISFVK